MGVLRPIANTWAAYEVPELLAMISAEDPNAVSDQLRGWWRAESTLIEYRQRLEACRDAIIEKWPPERSDAAAAFVRQTNASIDELDSAIVALGRNAGALAQTGATLSGARSELTAIYGEWQRSSQREEDAQVEANTVTFGDVRPTGLDPEWRATLNGRARVVMSGAEAELSSIAGNMVATPVPTPKASESYQWSPSAAEQGTGPTGHGEYALVTHPSVDRSVKAPEIPMPHGGPVHTSGTPSGIELAGQVSEVRGGASIGGPSPAVVDVGTMNRDERQMRDIGQLPQPVASSSPTRPSEEKAYRASRLVTTPRDSDPRARVVPVNGVIGGAPAKTAERLAPAQRFDERSDPALTGIGQRGTRQPTRPDSPKAFDRHERWLVLEGGPDVIAPPVERTHDVGPGVIGLDR